MTLGLNAHMNRKESLTDTESKDLPRLLGVLSPVFSDPCFLWLLLFKFPGTFVGFDMLQKKNSTVIALKII